ncbi:MAG TPA: MerR family transcriptional regulator [Solirubrobacteraceae bacterium]
MSELAERSGVSAGTIKHYLREGLLPEPVRTSRNMAYYPPEFVERIREIKRLQEQRFLPLKVIKDLVAAHDAERLSRADVAKRYELPRKLLDKLEELGVLTPTARGYDTDDVKIIAAMAAFRAGGYDEALGFTAYETVRYKQALEPLVREEVSAMSEHLADVEPERAAEIIAAGAEPLRELIGAMHSKLLLAELRRQAS